MAEFDIETPEQAPSAFETTLQSERLAKSLEPAEEPSKWEKAANVLPGMISAGASLFSAAQNKNKERALLAKQEEIAKTLQPVMQGISQGVLSGGQAKISLNALVRTKSAEFLERGDLEGHQLLLKASEGALTGKTGEALFALSPEEQLSAMQDAVNAKALQAKMQYIAEGRGTGPDWEHANRLESKAKLANDDLSRVRAQGAISAIQHGPAFIEAGSKFVDVAKSTLAGNLRSIDVTDPNAPEMQAQAFRIAENDIKSYYNDLIAGTSSIADHTERSKLQEQLKQQRDDRIKVITDQSIQKIAKENKELAKDLIEGTAAKELPDLAIINSAGGQEAVKAWLAARKQPALMEQLIKAYRIFGDLSGENQGALLSRTMSGILNGQLEALDPGMVSATRSYMVNGTAIPMEMKNKAIKSHFEQLKDKSASGQFHDMRMYLTSTGRNSIYGNKENQNAFSNGFTHGITEYKKDFQSNLQNILGKDATLPEGLELKVTLTKDGKKFVPKIENLNDILASLTKEKVTLQSEHVIDFLSSEKKNLENIIGQAALYEDLIDTKEDESLSEYFKRHLGFNVNIERRAGNF